MNKKYGQIIFIILLILGLVAGIVLVRQTQEIRRGAFFTSKDMKLLPDQNPLNIGDDLLVHLNVVGVGSSGGKVDEIRSVVCYNDKLVDIDPSRTIRQAVTINNASNSIFNHKYLVRVYTLSGRCSNPDRADADTACFGKILKTCNKGIWEDKEDCNATGKVCGDPVGAPASCILAPLPSPMVDESIIAPTSSPTPVVDGNTMTKCVDFTIGSEKGTADLKSEGEFAIVHLKANAVGTGKVKILNSYTQVAGDNVADPLIQVNSVSDLNYTIGVGPTATPVPTGVTVTPTTVPGTGPVLNFKMAFGYVLPDAGCANWKVQVKVIGKDGTTKTYDNVSLTKTNTKTSTNKRETTGLEIYKGTVQLAGFNQTSDLAVFIKGPKHLSMKYGIDNQDFYYNQPGGQISGLTFSEATSPTFDFSKYPLFPGDVTGGTEDPTDEVQDGVINGVDFSYVKSQSTARATIAPGFDIKSDLNGDCGVYSQDPVILANSLREKQEQTY